MKILLPISGCLIALAACNQTGVVVGEKRADTAVAVADLPALGEDFVTDTMAFPTYGDTAYPGKVLTTGRFHGDEVQDDASSMAWFGIFKNADGAYYLDTAHIMARHVEDIGDAGTPTGWEVTTANTDSSLMLISGFNLGRRAVLENLMPMKQQVIPGDTMAFDYKGSRYRLYATGLVKGDEYYNYKLYLTADKMGRHITQLLLAQPLSSRDNFPIYFIGDIDGDRFPDLMLDAACHENVEMPTLYLSRPADRNQLLLIAGKQNRVGC
jgi:hypothetical protein